MYTETISASEFSPDAKQPSLQDRIRGSLFGGGVGDALGYYIEFMRESAIFNQFGPAGITSYKLDPRTGKAILSDDTQMTLFTANGILTNSSYVALDGVPRKVEHTIAQSYQDWYYTQYNTHSAEKNTSRVSWLMDVPELFHRRAPGNTCLSGLATRANSGHVEDFIATPVNDSKGCGGVMRVAPLALIPWDSIEELDMAAAQVSAITHTHPLGYMSSSILCHIIHRIVFPTDKKMTLPQIVEEAKVTVEKLFAGTAYLQELSDIVDQAVLLSQNEASDLDNIHQLGEGWIAEEALAIAIYCSLKYPNNFSKAIIAAVNHKGDSDSTGAIAGNIVGAIVGYDGIAEKWKENLECKDVILELADDLYLGYASGSFCPDNIRGCSTKYQQMERLPSSESPVFFWHEYEENGYLCNWYPSKFVADNLSFHTMEQYIMFRKATLFGDDDSAEQILHTEDPKICKALGRKITPFDDAVWVENRYEVLKTGLLAKFQQNNELRAMLTATGNRMIVEASPHDSIYGIGLTKEEAAITAPENWPGINLLGKALMEVRAFFL